MTHPTAPTAPDVATAPTRADRPSTSGTDDRYVRPGRLTRRVVNPTVAFLTRRGLSVKGTRILEVRGRRSGQPRRTVVNLLPLDGARYLVAPRGQTQWVANVRAAGEATLRLGRRDERVRLVELADDAKVPVLRAYLEQWAWEVGAFFDGVDADSSDEHLAAIAPSFPAFEVMPG